MTFITDKENVQLLTGENDILVSVKNLPPSLHLLSQSKSDGTTLNLLGPESKYVPIQRSTRHSNLIK